MSYKFPHSFGDRLWPVQSLFTHLMHSSIGLMSPGFINKGHKGISVGQICPANGGEHTPHPHHHTNNGSVPGEKLFGQVALYVPVCRLLKQCVVRCQHSWYWPKVSPCIIPPPKKCFVVDVGRGRAAQS